MQVSGVALNSLHVYVTHRLLREVYFITFKAFFPPRLHGMQKEYGASYSSSNFLVCYYLEKEIKSENFSVYFF